MNDLKLVTPENAKKLSEERWDYVMNVMSGFADRLRMMESCHSHLCNKTDMANDTALQALKACDTLATLIKEKP